MSETPTNLIEVHAETTATPQQVMEVLEDGWLYALWVVGASHIRDVDPGWPKAGTKIHHAVGMWPFLLKDATESRSYDPDGSLELVARGWPIGEAFVRIEVAGTATGSRITMGERVISGPDKIIRPLESFLVPPRNREALHRLVAIVEGRRHP
jgi:hypothetical protein